MKKIINRRKVVGYCYKDAITGRFMVCSMPREIGGRKITRRNSTKLQG